MKPVEYVFSVDSLHPDTASMQRVAEYFLELSKLLGQVERVHFHDVTAGSLKCHALAEYEATPGIEDRVKLIAEAGSEPARVFDRLNQMLAKDNAVGRLDRIGLDGTTAKLYTFPGRELPKPTVFKVRQQGSLDGKVVSVGGRDNSSHMHLDAGDGRYFKCETSRELAVALAQHLYGDSIRVFGTGTWIRDAGRKWTLDGYFIVERFEVLTEETLSEALARMRAVGTDWVTEENILETCKSMREGSF
ncbi:MAG: hypothetical protein ACWA7E_10505 [Pseudomonas asiatica]